MIDQNELVRIFIKESQVHLESVETDLLELQKNVGNIDTDILDSILRGVRSIKGASGFYQFEKIGELSLKMNNLLLQIQYERIKANSEIIDAFLMCVAALKIMLNDISKSDQHDIEKELNLLAKYIEQDEESCVMVKVQDDSRQGEQAKEFEISAEKLALLLKAGQSLYTLGLSLKRDLTLKGKTPFDLINTINKNGEFIESSLDINCIQGLTDCLENDLSFVVLFATSTKPEIIPGELGISKDQISVIDMVRLKQKYGLRTDILFLEPKTDLVASQIEKLRDSFLEKLKANPDVSKVVFKADHIETVDSLGVNLIIGIYRQVNSESKTFEITGAGEKFLKVAKFFQFPALFNINSEE